MIFLLFIALPRLKIAGETPAVLKRLRHLDGFEDAEALPEAGGKPEPENVPDNPKDATAEAVQNKETAEE